MLDLQTAGAATLDYGNIRQMAFEMGVEKRL